MFREYPYLNLTDLNLDYIYRQLVKMKETLNEYVEQSTITFHDPIMWDITDQYTRNTMVIDTDGTAYLSVQPVPAGIDITNTNYWQPIFNYDDSINKLMSSLAENTRTTGVLTENKNVGDIVWYQGNLYVMTAAAVAGSVVTPDGNCRAIRMDTWLQDIYGAISDRMTQIETEFEQVKDLATIVTPESYGAVGDGVTDDTAAVQDALDTGKAVYFSKSYLISDALEYDGPWIMGNGTLIVDSLPSTKSAAFVITGDNVTVNGISINGANKCAIGLSINVTGMALVQNVACYNFNTSYYDGDVGCIGIYIRHSDQCEVGGCYVHDLYRTSGQFQVQSSVGIFAGAERHMYVHDNVIERVKAFTTYDCDGIYCSSGSGFSDVGDCVVENNRIVDATGRFIKTFAQRVRVSNNRCLLTEAFTPATYFHCVAMQRGSGEIVNNYFDLGSSVHRSYTRCFKLEVYDDTPRDYVISGNTVISAGTTSPQIIRNYVEVTTTGDNNVSLHICDNDFNGKSEGFASLCGTVDAEGMHGNCSIKNNRCNTYQMFDVSNSQYKGIDNIFVDVQGNENVYGAGTRFMQPNATIKNVIYKQNSGIVGTINSGPVSYTDLEIFECFYKGTMNDTPAAIGANTNIYMQKDKAVCRFKCFANDNEGTITV